MRPNTGEELLRFLCALSEMGLRGHMDPVASSCLQLSPPMFAAATELSDVCFCCREDKGALAKLVEAVKTNYNERYDEVRYSWRDFNVLLGLCLSTCKHQTKSVALI